MVDDQNTNSTNLIPTSFTPPPTPPQPTAFPEPPAYSPISAPVTPAPVPEPPTVAIPVPPIDNSANESPLPKGDQPTAERVTSTFEGQGSGKYKVVVLKDKCIGAASCVAVASKTFKLNDQQIAEVMPTVNQESDDNLLLAAQSCPTMAIEVYDTVTGEKIWPK